jgi:hypothetical protein
MQMSLPSRVDVTTEAAELLLKLTKINGPLMFHQSGGCCDGSSPMCFLKGEFRLGGSDVLLGELNFDGLNEAIRVWISASQFEYWKHTHLTIDLVDGRGGGFSLESPEGKRFLIRSRLFSDEEWALLENAPITTGA